MDKYLKWVGVWVEWKGMQYNKYLSGYYYDDLSAYLECELKRIVKNSKKKRCLFHSVKDMFWIPVISS